MEDRRHGLPEQDGKEDDRKRRIVSRTAAIFGEDRRFHRLHTDWPNAF